MNVRNNNPVRVGEFYLLLLGDDIWIQNLETERPIFQLLQRQKLSGRSGCSLQLGRSLSTPPDH